ncbi:MAG TPA: Rrf2 family transcriptional regulator [Armatimonadetes bacterium]|nr:Rrf2 family transcriptional regulator [Armatimonadota bacterium]
MKLSTKARYGMRALVDLARHYENGPVALKDIAERQGLSKKYLEHIVASLRAAGFVLALPGAHGGHVLAKPPAEIQVSEVLKVLEGSLAPAECLEHPECCDRTSFCVTRDLWEELHQAMARVLEATTLQDLVERERQKAQKREAMYYI